MVAFLSPRYALFCNSKFYQTSSHSTSPSPSARRTVRPISNNSTCSVSPLASACRPSRAPPSHSTSPPTWPHRFSHTSWPVRVTQWSAPLPDGLVPRVTAPWFDQLAVHVAPESVADQSHASPNHHNSTLSHRDQLPPLAAAATSPTSQTSEMSSQSPWSSQSQNISHLDRSHSRPPLWPVPSHKNRNKCSVSASTHTSR